MRSPTRLKIATIASLLLCLVGLALPGRMQDAAPLAVADSSAPMALRSPRLGINHISLTEDDPNAADRYALALALGAGWNRWPLYWDRIETAPGVYDWSTYDQLVQADREQGLRINAVLLGRPIFAQAGSSIAGLQEPIFADRSDYPQPGKSLNPDNLWANFVFEAVSRYAGQIDVWEVWNEPDLDMFWQGGIPAYARLLKVAYLAAKHADPDAVIMFGGLLYPTQDNWLAQVLRIYENDPLREQFNWYMDQVAVHNYGYPWRSGWLTLYVRQTLSAYKLRRPIWLNESGVRVWDDYPGPLWAADLPDLRVQRATAEQQASFFIQSAAYAWAEGADVVFFHQLFDDCGDHPPGTDFGFHRGELCSNGAACYGDAYGLYRNQADSVCFSQHPQPGTARPAAEAYRLVAEIFGTEPFEKPRAQRLANRRVQVIAFERPASSERIYVLWNRTFEPVSFELPVSGDQARLYTVRSRRALRPQDGVYRLSLPPAQPDNYPNLEPGDVSAIGGMPVILIERVPNLNIVPTFLLPPTPTPAPSPTPDETATPESS